MYFVGPPWKGKNWLRSKWVATGVLGQQIQVACNVLHRMWSAETDVGR